MSRDETTRSVELLERWIRMLEKADDGAIDVAEEMRQRWLELLRKEAAQ